MEKIKYPVGDSSFPYIRENGFFYIDKTSYIYRMADEGKYYFLSRPRRFGKSLLVSTMEAFFSGKKSLFKGLAIEREEWVWEKYPVLHLDLSNEDMSRYDGLISRLEMEISRWEDQYGRDEREIGLPTRFSGIIRRAHEKTGLGVVVLIDEYDNPLFSSMEEEEENRKMRPMLRGLFSVLKAETAHIRFCFLTGITRFSKMSVFSGLNNLQDLSLDDEYSGICGITQEELDKCCQAGILQVSEMNGIGEEEAREQLRKRYDGYHFSEGSVDVYNPYSLMQVFKTGKMKSYWFTSGTSQLLWRQVSKLSDEESLTGVLYPILSEQELEASEDDGMTLPSLLYQTGYLTIKGLTPTKRAYQLGIPNEEVKEGIMGGLLPLISRRTPRKTGSDLERLRDYADRGKT